MSAKATPRTSATTPRASRNPARATAATARPRYPATPDGRYFVVRGRLWRRSNPALSEDERARHTRALMAARSAVGRALRAGDTAAEKAAREAVHSAKLALGERGDPWWDDGAPDFNRRLARNTPYARWFAELPPGEPEG